MKKNNYKITQNKKVKKHAHNKSYNNKYKAKFERVIAIKPKKGSKTTPDLSLLKKAMTSMQ